MHGQQHIKVQTRMQLHLFQLHQSFLYFAASDHIILAAAFHGRVHNSSPAAEQQSCNQPQVQG